MKKFVAFVSPVVGRFLLVLAFVLALALGSDIASAQTDITSTISALSGYWSSIATLAITVVVFVIGRKFLRKV